MADKIKAKITDIKVDKDAELAVVGVELSVGDEAWKKAFRVRVDERIEFDMFKKKLVDAVKKDLRIKKNISSLEDRLKKPFSLDLEENASTGK